MAAKLALRSLVCGAKWKRRVMAKQSASFVLVYLSALAAQLADLRTI